MSSSRIPGIHRLGLEERLYELKNRGLLQDEDLKAFMNPVPLDEVVHLSENVVGRLTLPLGVATNFIIDGTERLVTMATEEASVVAAASHAAKAARAHGGFHCSGGEPLLEGQVHLVDVDPARAGARVRAAAPDLLEIAREAVPSMVRRGGGPKEVLARTIDLPEGESALAVHVVVDTRDAMGANLVNTVCEALAPELESLTGGRALMRILSNHCPRRLATAEATFDADVLGRAAVRDIVKANQVAAADPYRAVTHMKGVMNGVTAVVLATGNDTRAVESACHAWTWRDGLQLPTSYELTPEGHLHGRLTLPIAVGVVGGATRTNPAAAAALRVMGISSGPDLARTAAAAGLAQNVAALRALVSEGIQRGHMRLHARALLLQEGLPADRLDDAVADLVGSGNVTASAAAEVARQHRG